jgi:hypothetical protein
MNKNKSSNNRHVSTTAIPGAVLDLAISRVREYNQGRNKPPTPEMVQTAFKSQIAAGSHVSAVPRIVWLRKDHPTLLIPLRSEKHPAFLSMLQVLERM